MDNNIEPRIYKLELIMKPKLISPVQTTTAKSTDNGNSAVLETKEFYYCTGQITYQKLLLPGLQPIYMLPQITDVVQFKFT